jgi:hypothetical protein
MENKELKFSQLKACYLITSGINLKDVGSAVGVSEQTIFRWLKLPEFQAELRELKRIVIERSLGKLQNLNDKAIQTLSELLDCQSSPAARCRAASIILTKNHESIDFFEYSERLRLIEQRFSNENK